MPRRVPDTSKAQRFIGFTPRTPLDDILREVIRDRSQRNSEPAFLAGAANRAS
jgi:hypothetical protein